MTSLPHSNFYIKSLDIKRTQDGSLVDVVDLNPVIGDSGVMSLWAKHIRNIYCDDSKIDQYIDGTGKTKSQYLELVIFPEAAHIISGDFAEIIVADYVEYVLNYYVPRTKFDNKGANRNSSTMGTDFIGFKIIDPNSPNIDDEMITCEVKAALVSKNVSVLQKAVNDSVKDFELRASESLNAIKRRLIDKTCIEEAKTVQRFQYPVDNPFKSTTSAAAVNSNQNWHNDVIDTADCSNHPNKENLKLLVIKGDDLMNLARLLFKIARDEA